MRRVVPALADLDRPALPVRERPVVGRHDEPLREDAAQADRLDPVLLAPREPPRHAQPLLEVLGDDGPLGHVDGEVARLEPPLRHDGPVPADSGEFEGVGVLVRLDNQADGRAFGAGGLFHRLGGRAAKIARRSATPPRQTASGRGGAANGRRGGRGGLARSRPAPGFEGGVVSG